MKPFLLSIHLFRRDLRLDDNSALLAALSQSEKVLPVFIFDKRQLSNPYKGNNSLEFMVNSLAGLNEELKKKSSRLYLFRGIAHEIVDEILSSIKVDALFVNRDYTPFSINRDKEIVRICRQHKTEFFSYADALLTEPEQVHKNDGLPYTVYTPFMKKARMLNVAYPVKNSYSNYFSGNLKMKPEIGSPVVFIKKTNPNLLLKGGREEGLQLLDATKKLTVYDEIRDFPAREGTSFLSAHHKFGTISIRETYHKIADQFGEGCKLIDELYWRDFFTHIVFHYPHVFQGAFHQKFDSLAWENDENKFKKWCNGQTGFPIVDAGMRELTTTGYMHNRVRMIVASFLTKDLHIDWHWGERFFANYLIDYDPAVNNGNWQWAASTGCDAQPYFRIFNPWLQQKKFDSECMYIKKWVSELRELKAKEIHTFGTKPDLHIQYPRVIVNHKEQTEKTKQTFKNLQ